MSTNGRRWGWAAWTALVGPVIAVLTLLFGQGFCVPPWDVIARGEADLRYVRQVEAARAEQENAKAHDRIEADYKASRAAAEEFRKETAVQLQRIDDKTWQILQTLRRYER